jgi:serine/threonine protein kinase
MKFKADCRVNGVPVPCVLLGNQICMSTFVELLKGFTGNQELDILSTRMFESVQVPEGDSQDSGFSEVIAICTQIGPTTTADALKRATNAMIRGDYDTDGTRTQWLCKYIIGMDDGCSEETRQTATGMLTMLRSNKGVVRSSPVAKRSAAVVSSLDLFAGVTLLEQSRVRPLTEDGQYELFEENLLGRGSFADVYRGQYKFPNQPPSPVAFKVFRNSRSNIKDIQFEAQSHSRLGQSHDNIIGFQGVITELDVITELGTDRRLVFVLELAEGGSLRDVLDNRSLYPHLDWHDRVRWLLQMAEGMEKMHSLKPHAIIHRDLKTANVLLASKPSADQTTPTTVKITDFGVAKESAETVRSTMGTYGTQAAAGGGRTGTLSWKAPETFVKAETEKSDVFSFGVTAFEVATRSLPYLGMNEREIERRARDRFVFSKARAQRGVVYEAQHAEWLEDHPVTDRRPDLQLIEEGCSPGIKDIIQRCWADEPADRPTFTECVADLHAISGLDTTEKLAAVEQEAQEAASKKLAAVEQEAQEMRQQVQELQSSPRGVRRNKAMPLDSTSAYTLWELAMADADHLSARTLLSNTWLKAGTFRLLSEPNVKVSIVDHPQHTERYEEYKSQAGNQNERLLFHGCHTEAMASIVENGFQKKYWKSSAGSWQRFGPGFYFALQASKSHDYPLPQMRALSQGQHRRAMLLCKVAVGREFDTPTNMDKLTGPPPGFHSVHGLATGEKGAHLNYDELVVYEEAAILPWAVVEYDFVKT